ncbi:hypothetical protein HMPREF1544_00734 [Mucor circinelloides 1006PhL]|uniref:Uncharacterized protein n=1 Tax=Mucor circinelloides f. circinelloides (strain 1006PhL) TaxID=1220926 RepID=S2JQ66_MUCC1|nr:hypothetical protein HMPREF1544_00734 [Mucor circinelloides 1006PhL]
MRFNILSLGLVATVFMSASISAIPVGDTLGGLGSTIGSTAGGTVSDTVDVGGTVSGDVDVADQATGGIVKRGRHHRNDEVVDGVEGRATGGAGDALAGGAENGAGGATDAVSDVTGGLRKRRVHRRKGGHGGRGVRVDTVGDVVQDAVQNAGATIGNVLGGLTTRGVHDTAGKRKRSVVGEPDEEEADEEEPEEEEVDENEEETDEEEADELGDAAPAGRR